MKESSEYLSHSDVGEPVQKSLMVRGREAEGQIGHPWLGTSRRWTTPHSLGEHVVWRALVAYLLVQPPGRTTGAAPCPPGKVWCGRIGHLSRVEGRLPTRIWMTAAVFAKVKTRPGRERYQGGCVCVCMTEVSDGYNNIYQIQIRLRSRSRLF